MSTPRPFQAGAERQDAKECKICDRPFSMLRRRHHCRNCGATVCHDHSASSVPLISLGLETPVRVCDTCKASLSDRGIKTSLAKPQDTETPRDTRAAETSPMPSPSPVAAPAVECKCGMPLCICTPEPVEPVAAPSGVAEIAASSEQQSASKPKPKPPAFNPFNQWSTNTISVASGGVCGPEQLRDAIKTGSLAQVRDVASKRGDAAFLADRDELGNSPLHLAAMLSHMKIVDYLLEAGASTTVRNKMGETPADVASATLASRITGFRKE